MDKNNSLVKVLALAGLTLAVASPAVAGLAPTPSPTNPNQKKEMVTQSSTQADAFTCSTADFMGDVCCKECNWSCSKK